MNILIAAFYVICLLDRKTAVSASGIILCEYMLHIWSMNPVRVTFMQVRGFVGYYWAQAIDLCVKTAI